MTFATDVTAASERLEKMGAIARRALSSFPVSYQCTLPGGVPIMVEIAERTAKPEMLSASIGGHDILTDLSDDARDSLYAQVLEHVASDLADRCNVCGGSGEGHSDGSRCFACLGR